MRNATWDQRTVIQTHDPADGDRYVMLLTMEGVTLPIASPPSLAIDGEPWFAVRRAVAIDTKTRTAVTTITVVPES